MFASLVGRKVTVKVRSLASYEGLFSGCNMDKGEYTVLLKFARELPSETRLSGPVHDQMLIPGKEIIQMNALDVPEDGVELRATDDKGREFKTDSEINTRRFQAKGERQLESWADLKDETLGHDMELEAHSSGWSNTHDQFVVAKQMGVVSTYREDLYTTPLNMDSMSKEQRERAERIAKEIEGGRNFSSQEEGGDGDEEAMFSAVIGTGGHKKPGSAHPSETASSWRRPPPESHESAATSGRAANTRLNALNLEPATLRNNDPKPIVSKPAVPSPPPRPITPTSASASEMKGINALNLEPAAVTRAAQWDPKSRAGGRGAPAPAASSAQPTKKDFEIALAEIKSREQRQPGAPVGKGKGGKGGAGSQPVASPSGTTSPRSAAAAAAGSKFSFNPNASTFTPGSTSNGGNTLSIAMTPGGSLSGTLKGSNYDYYEPGASPPPGAGGPPPMPPPPMLMYPPPPFGMPMMPPPQMGPPPAFGPLVEASQVDKTSMGDLTSKFVEKAGKSSSSSFVWTDAKSAGPSFKEILGPLPPGIGPVMPPMPPPMMMAGPPMMAGGPPPMMAAYGMPAYAPYYPGPPMGMPGGRRGQQAFVPYGMYPPPPQQHGGYRGGPYRSGPPSGSQHSSTPPPSE